MKQESYPVSGEKQTFYQENGFVQFQDVITPKELEELRQWADEAMDFGESVSTQPDRNNKGYARVLNQRLNVWRDHGGMARYSLHERFAGIASRLLGGKHVRLLHDHLLYKMPGDSKPTPWHQDLPYWPMNETGALSMWLPLDDVDEQNGCMMFVPGSHKVGKLTAVDLVNPQNIYEFEGSENARQDTAVKIPLRAGSCTFHDGLTFHYAHSNVTDRPRRVLAVIYFPDGATYNGKPHILCDHAAWLKEGKPLAGPLFPVLA
ncbi:phytanoyl-CoA dioxygenase family protein [Paenibacillus gansuensis]|uniref:Phytanoyl-CoA dioxygenase family protein n=1 Tax=Paenibacillus gansuensis TaxID=306542 RepID=A0ABW5PJS1_9BACL